MAQFFASIQIANAVFLRRSKKTIVDSQQIKHIQAVQQNEMRQWHGMQVQFTQRPGMGNIHTNRKFFQIADYFKVRERESPGLTAILC